MCSRICPAQLTRPHSHTRTHAHTHAHKHTHTFNTAVWMDCLPKFQMLVLGKRSGWNLPPLRSLTFAQQRTSLMHALQLWHAIFFAKQSRSVFIWSRNADTFPPARAISPVQRTHKDLCRVWHKIIFWKETPWTLFPSCLAHSWLWFVPNTRHWMNAASFCSKLHNLRLCLPLTHCRRNWNKKLPCGTSFQRVLASKASEPSTKHLPPSPLKFWAEECTEGDSDHNWASHSPITRSPLFPCVRHTDRIWFNARDHQLVQCCSRLMGWAGCALKAFDQENGSALSVSETLNFRSTQPKSAHCTEILHNFLSSEPGCDMGVLRVWFSAAAVLAVVHCEILISWPPGQVNSALHSSYSWQKHACAAACDRWSPFGKENYKTAKLYPFVCGFSMSRRVDVCGWTLLRSCPRGV